MTRRRNKPEEIIAKLRHDLLPATRAIFPGRSQDRWPDTFRGGHPPMGDAQPKPLGDLIRLERSPSAHFLAG